MRPKSTIASLACALVLGVAACGDGAGDAGPTCGNGIVEDGEECDNGTGLTLNGCTWACELDASLVCGDGWIQVGEQCDDGNTTDGDGCSSTCRLEYPEHCGNGIVDHAEHCDDGNRENGDGCDQFCQLEPVAECGNGVIEPDEECDDGPWNSDTEPDACRTDCHPARCGDGVLDHLEWCDDGNTTDGDGCDSCQFPYAAVCFGHSGIACGETRTASTADAVLVPRADRYSCTDTVYPDQEYIYSFGPGGHAAVTVAVESTVEDLGVLVLEGSCYSGACLAAGEPAVTFEVEKNLTYYLVVDGRSGVAGDFSITVTCDFHENCSNQIDDDGNGWIDCEDLVCYDDPACQ